MTLHRFDVKMIKTTQNNQSDQMTMNCMHLTSNWQKCRVLSQNIQNNAKLQKWSKYNDFASIWCQNDQNNAKLPKRSNYDELHEFDVELAKMSSFVTKHSKQRKTPKVIKVQWLCIDLMSKWSKQRKTTKAIKLRWIAWIWRRIGKNVEFCHKTFKTTQNSKSDQNTMTWIDLMSNWQKCRVLSQNIQNNAKLQKWSKYNDLNRFDVELAKMSSFVTKHSKQRKTTKSIKLRWIAWIWRRIGKNVEFCHKTFKTTQNSKSDQSTMTLHRFDVKTFKTTRNSKSDQNTMTWIDLMSNWQKCRVLSQNIQNNAKLQKWSKYNDFASIWCQNDQNNAKLPNRSNYDELHAFDVELAKMSSFVKKHSKQRKTPKVIKIQWLESIWCRIGKNVEFCHKTFKTTQNSKSDQNTMTWIDLMSNWQKCRVLSQNIQNNAKTKSDQNTMTLHRFDVKMIKTTQNYQIDQITMNCMDLTSNWQKCRVLSQNIQNNAKLQKWSKYNDFASIWCQNDQNNAKLPNWSNYDELHGFDVELAKMSSFVTKHSKHRKTPKVIKVQWLCIDLMSNWQKCRVLSQNIQNNAKTKSDQNTMTLHRFDVKMIKTTQNYQIDQMTMNCMDLTSNWQKCRVSVTKHSKQRKTPKVIKVQWLCIDLMSKWSKQRKTTKLIKLRWIAWIWRRISKNVEFCHKTFKTP